MPFENRDYARREAVTDQGWTRGVQWLVAANVAAFLGAFLATKLGAGSSPKEVYDLLGLVPDRAVEDHRLWQVLTYSFVHDLQNPFHLILDAYVLWVAGRDVETLYGTARFVKLYFAAAAFSALVFLAVAGAVPAIGATPLLGAAGPAIAILVIHAAQRPREKILLYLLFEVPIWAGVLVMAGLVLLVTRSGPGGTAAAASFLAAGAFGYGTHRLRLHVEAVLARSAPPPVTARTPRERPAPPRVSPPPAPALTLEAELDLVLKKIHEKGMGVLTDDEKGVLDRASRHYRGERRA